MSELRPPAPAAPSPSIATPAPAGTRRPSRREADVTHISLPGADLLVRRKSGVPLVNLGIYVPRADFEPAAQAGLAALMTRSAVRGAGDMDAGTPAFAFERLGGTLSASAASDWTGFGTTVLAEHLAPAAALLHRVHAFPRLDDAEVERERALMVAEAEQVADDMFRYPFQLAFAAAFGETGYGLPVSGLPETLRSLTGADARAWHRRSPGVRPVVIAVGDVDPEPASETLAAAFADLPPRQTIADPPGLTWIGGQEGSPARVVTRDKAQAALAMAFPGLRRRDPDRAAAQVWAAVASGLGGRLFEALRDRRSLAYTVVASAWLKARAGALVTYIATSPEREDEAREQMLHELGRFTREPVSPAELQQAVNYLAGQAEVSRQSGGGVAAEILEAWVAGNGLSELADPAAPFRAVTAEDVLRVAAGSLDPARKVEAVVRGTGAARAPVGAL